jgi:hypothetical protein
MSYEMIRIIALLCQVYSSSSAFQTMDIQQRCQKNLTKCYFTIKDHTKENFEEKCIVNMKGE